MHENLHYQAHNIFSVSTINTLRPGLCRMPCTPMVLSLMAIIGKVNTEILLQHISTSFRVLFFYREQCIFLHHAMTTCAFKKSGQTLFCKQRQQLHFLQSKGLVCHSCFITLLLLQHFPSVTQMLSTCPSLYFC